MPSLTYAELGAVLKIAPESANRLSRRRRWPRAKGNDGRTRVSVPEEALALRDKPQDSPSDSLSGTVHELQARVARLEGELAGKDETIREAQARADAAEARAAELSSALAAEKTTAATAVAAIGAFADRLEALAAERAKPWWRRLAG